MQARKRVRSKLSSVNYWVKCQLEKVDPFLGVLVGGNEIRPYERANNAHLKNCTSQSVFA